MKLEFPPTSWPTFCLLRNTRHRLIGIQSHIDYLTKCKELNIITKGLYHHSKVIVGHKKFEREAQEKMNLIIKGVTKWIQLTGIRINTKMFRKNFSRSKQSFQECRKI